MICLFENCDFSKPMFGDGCAAVVASAIRQVGEKFVLIGATSSQTHEVGKWTVVELFGKEMDFLPIMTVDELHTTALQSEKLLFFFRLIKYRKILLKKNIRNAFTQNYAALWWLVAQGDFKICYYYPGLANPFIVGRKPRLGKLLSCIYDKIQALAIRKAEIALAAASIEEIKAYEGLLLKKGVEKKVHQLTTSVNIKLFCPKEKSASRKIFDINNDAFVFVFTGRLAWVKGIPLLIEALAYLVSHGHENSMLILIGDGEEREKLKSQIGEMGLLDNVKFLGKLPPSDVCLAIGSADVCAVSSYAEGFSCTMLEHLSCGKPLVTTDVSGSHELVSDGLNGYILANRDPVDFAKKLLLAANLPHASLYSRKLILDEFSEEAQWKKLSDVWLPLKEEAIP